MFNSLGQQVFVKFDHLATNDQFPSVTELKWSKPQPSTEKHAQEKTDGVVKYYNG